MTLTDSAKTAVDDALSLLNATSLLNEARAVSGGNKFGNMRLEGQNIRHVFHLNIVSIMHM